MTQQQLLGRLAGLIQNLQEHRQTTDLANLQDELLQSCNEIDRILWELQPANAPEVEAA